jgi:hypothetical protein
MRRSTHPPLPPRLQHQLHSAEINGASRSGVKRDSIPDGRYDTQPIARRKEAEWGVDRDVFRGILRSATTDHLIIAYRET